MEFSNVPSKSLSNIILTFYLNKLILPFDSKEAEN